MVARNSTAFGLKQPHLERTRLCQLTDAELDPGYVAQRTALRELVGRLAKPKASLGCVLVDVVSLRPTWHLMHGS